MVQIVDAAMAEAGRKSGVHLACRPGCTPCCLGPFEITRFDALRLQAGMRALDSDCAQRVRERALRYIGVSDDEPCPALDPETGWCELYESRPVICRTFGPAIRGKDGRVGVCELCYVGVSDDEVERCSVEIDWEEQEDVTTVAQALGGQAGGLPHDVLPSKVYG